MLTKYSKIKQLNNINITEDTFIFFDACYYNNYIIFNKKESLEFLKKLGNQKNKEGYVQYIHDKLYHEIYFDIDFKFQDNNLNNGIERNKNKINKDEEILNLINNMIKKYFNLENQNIIYYSKIRKIDNDNNFKYSSHILIKNIFVSMEINKYICKELKNEIDAFDTNVYKKGVLFRLPYSKKIMINNGEIIVNVDSILYDKYDENKPFLIEFSKNSTKITNEEYLKIIVEKEDKIIKKEENNIIYKNNDNINEDNLFEKLKFIILNVNDDLFCDYDFYLKILMVIYKQDFKYDIMKIVNERYFQIKGIENKNYESFFKSLERNENNKKNKITIASLIWELKNNNLDKFHEFLNIFNNIKTHILGSDKGYDINDYINDISNNIYDLKTIYDKLCKIYGVENENGNILVYKRDKLTHKIVIYEKKIFYQIINVNIKYIDENDEIKMKNLKYIINSIYPEYNTILRYNYNQNIDFVKENYYNTVPLNIFENIKKEEIDYNLISPIIEYLFYIICDSNILKMRYILDWFKIILDGEQIPLTAMIIKGTTGSGKSLFFTKIIEMLFPNQYNYETNFEEIYSRNFNSGLLNKKICLTMEGKSNPHIINRNNIAKENALITDNTLSIEQKFRERTYNNKNILNFIILTNYKILNENFQRRFNYFYVGTHPFYDSLNEYKDLKEEEINKNYCFREDEEHQIVKNLIIDNEDCTPYIYKKSEINSENKTEFFEFMVNYFDSKNKDFEKIRTHFYNFINLRKLNKKIIGNIKLNYETLDNLSFQNSKNNTININYISKTIVNNFKKEFNNILTNEIKDDINNLEDKNNYEVKRVSLSKKNINLIIDNTNQFIINICSELENIEIIQEYLKISFEKLVLNSTHRYYIKKNL